MLDKKRGHRKKLFLVLLPNPGIIDQWLPVIDRMGSRVDLVLFSPQPSNLYQLRDDDQMVKILSRHITRVVFRVEGVGWFHAETIKKAKEINRACVKGSRFFRGGNGFGLRYVFKMIRLGIGWAGRLRFRKHVTDMNAEIAAGDKIIGDFGAFNETCMEDVVTALSGCDIYSLCHGNAPVIGLDKCESAAFCESRFLNLRTINLYAFSAEAEQQYKKRYKLYNVKTQIAGIPRHDYSWISYVQQGEEFRLFENYIYVISRPSNSKYFPADQKFNALQDIKAAADKFGLQVVIRAHPKESRERVFFDVFGKAGYGNRWLITQQHSFCIGRGAAFAVVFLSGICADITRLSVPTIERLNLKGQSTKHTSGLPGEFQFHTNEPTSIYAAAGLVLQARTRPEFFLHVQRVLYDREKVMSELQKAYAQHFAEPNVEQVVRDILA